MTKTFKKSVAFISAAVMVMTMLLYFPSGIFSIDFGLKASAAATITLSAPTEGDGSSDNPYQISTKEELYWFAACVNGTDGVTRNTAANAVLTADIVVNENVLNADGTPNGTDFTSWTPISTSYYKEYTGTFDGKNHTISGLYFNDTSKKYVGLFGYVTIGGTVSNVGVVDSYFSGSNFVGGVCGENYGTIECCYNTGTVSGTEQFVGGVCGYNDSGTIKNCYNEGSVSGARYVGGVCGVNNSGTITNCYDTGNVSGSEQVGGVCGYNYSGTIKNCYYDRTVYSGDAVGDNSGTTTNVESKYSTEFSNGTVCGLVGYHSHQNGICALCGEYYPANKTTDKYNIDGVEGFDEVYEIGNAGQLYWFAALVNGTLTDGTAQNKSANAVLTVNITVNTGDVASCNGTKGDGWIDWTPISGKDSANISSSDGYKGTFDGDNHTISGLFCNLSAVNHIGLFGCNDGTIKNVGVIDSYIQGKSSVGGVCGANFGTITNCYNTGTVKAVSGVGGVCGNNRCTENNTVTISNCYNTGTISAEQYNIAGGVCGVNYGYEFGGTVKIINCYNTGKVTCSGIVGGVCGRNYINLGNAEITNCYFNKDNYSGSPIGSDEYGIVTKVEGKTTDDFNSGEVAYLLSQGENGSVWGQEIGTDSMPVMGGKKVLTNVDESQFVNDVIIYGQNAALDGTIDFNIYVAADDNYEWSASFNNTVVEKPAKDENGLYKFTCEVAAKDMAKNIEFYINDDVKATVSVSDYLTELKNSEDEDTPLANLVTAMETYGTAADAFFSNGTVEAVEGVTAETLSGYAFTKNDAPEGISYYGSSLLLKSETTVRHYFKLAEGKNIGEFTFTVNGSTVTPVEKQDYYYIDIENISADKLGTPHTVKIGDIEVISNYSALSYAKTVLEKSDDENLKNLVKALYIYNQNALAYINAD